MRLWSLHPQYLDRQGLTGLWREALLAQAVLRGKTRGYRSHPQLARFRGEPEPLAAVAAYLQAVLEEGNRRGYHFDAGKIIHQPAPPPLSLPRGQLLYEWERLLSKLQNRSPECYAHWAGLEHPEPHPLFQLVEGGIEPWEKVLEPEA